MVSRLWSQESSSQVTLARMRLFEGAGTFLPGTQGEHVRKGPLVNSAFSPHLGPGQKCLINSVGGRASLLLSVRLSRLHL